MNRSRANSLRSRALWVGIVALGTLVRCGGTIAPSNNTTEGLAIDAGASCPANAKGQLHRCQSPTCSVSVVQARPCKSDGDCVFNNDAGALYEGTCNAGTCRPDRCFTDSDCPSGTVCICAGDLGALLSPVNLCVPANCRNDSDCGPDGVCSPSIRPGTCGSLDSLDGFFCHTPQDKCASDDDCALQQSGTFCGHAAGPSSS